MSGGDAGVTISLPTGGGGIQGLGETFAPDLHTGTGNFAVPIALPAGRAGAQPNLTLTYSTGNGNGPFGLGWSVALPGVSRKTSRGIPHYRDVASPAGAADVFLLAGGDDLVAVERGLELTRYRPRTEGLFARIEHHHRPGTDHWEVRSPDGLLNYYGSAGLFGTDPATTADPSHPAHIYAWHLSRTMDPSGNVVLYDYVRDAGRTTGHRWDQPLLHRIRYADYGDPAQPSFLVEVELEYEARPDPFSDHRAGFEIRTTQRCTRVQVTTHSGDDVDHPVREYRLSYVEDSYNGASLLAAVEMFGFDDAGARSSRSVLPPLTFGYSTFEPRRRRFEPIGNAGLPRGWISNPDVELVDVDGNGLVDVVELNGVARCWRNLGDGRFDRPRPMEMAPPHRLRDPGVSFVDANGDGRADLLINTGAMAGHYPMSLSGGWDRRSFRPSAHAPSVAFNDPDVRLLDLDGDGLTDVLRSGSRFECFFNDLDRMRSWQRSASVERQGLASFPNISFSDPEVRLADMTGDGLTDIVVIRDGLVQYWPNRGHGRWGERVTMDRSPRFPYGYDPRRILLGDVDGDGLADVLYVDHGRVQLWVNQMGNRWTAEPVEISGTPPTTDPASVRLVDLTGSGVSGLLWSSTVAVPDVTREWFLDLMGRVKPCLLTRIDNHLGVETRIGYRASTEDYLRDIRAGSSWRATLPFPVHVVGTVESTDHFSASRQTTEYRYHHGYWDGEEREFRGFGMVERLDTETLDSAPAGHAPPTITKTWFHQGPVQDEAGDWRELDHSGDFWTGDPPALARPSELAQWLADRSRRDRRDAIRALRGTVIRSELYGLDGSARESRPYTVCETLRGIGEVSPGDGGARAIFWPVPIAERATEWQRGSDPMSHLTFSGQYDAYGNACRRLSVAVPRGRDYRRESPGGSPYLATCEERLFAQADEPDRYMVDRVAGSRTYEVVNDGTPTAVGLWDLILAGRASLSPIACTVQFYDGDPFEGLPFATLGARGAVTRTESLVLADATVRQAYGGALPPYLDPAGATPWGDEYPGEFRTALPALAGYLYRAGGVGSPYVDGFYVSGSRTRYDFHDPGLPARGLPIVTRDSLGNDTRVRFDAHHVLPVEIIDPVGLRVTTQLNYRLLEPESVADANGNVTRVTFNALGRVDSVFVRGAAAEGDQERPSIRFEYDLLAFLDRGQPPSLRTISYEHHDSDAGIDPSQRDATVETVEYSDGRGRVLQIRAHADDVSFGDPVFGWGVLPTNQGEAAGDALGRRRAPGDAPSVIVTGSQVHNNKGWVVESFQPYFSQGFGYRPAAAEQLGAKTSTSYDPVGSVVRVVNPDGSEQRVVPGVPGSIASPDPSDPDTYEPTPWETYTYDERDNASRSHGGGEPSHHDTPASVEVDALGRTTMTVRRNGPDPTRDWLTTRSVYDIQGNLLAVIDALGRTCFRNTFDLVGRTWRTESIDAGVHRTVFDAAGTQIENRDSRGALVLRGADTLQRPSRVWARDDAAAPLTLRQRLEYGDGGSSRQPQAERDAMEARNLLGRLHRHHDEAGLTVIDRADFKGNVVEEGRRLIADGPVLQVYAEAAARGWRIDPFVVDWTTTPGRPLAAREQELLEGTSYRTSTEFDALNRVTLMRHPQDTEGTRPEVRPRYDRSGGLAGLRLDGTTYVERVAYDAVGRRTLIAYGNGVMTRAAFDAKTTRLERMRTERYRPVGELQFQPVGPPLQELGYRYDLLGNLVAITDRAPESGIPGNPEAAAEPDTVLARLLASGDALVRRFAYDPLSRLIESTGRECAVLEGAPPWLNGARCTDLTRTRPYAERYRYDAVDALTRLEHRHQAGGFVRDLDVEAGTNRVHSVRVGQAVYRYEYDAGGNLRSEGTSRHFEWTDAAQMKVFRTQVEGAEPSVHAQYLYDAGGGLVKTVVRKQGGQVTVAHRPTPLFEHARLVHGSDRYENNTVHLAAGGAPVALVRIGHAFPDDPMPPVTYYLADHAGSATMVVDGAGAWITREEFTPYGETSYGGQASKRYRFAGGERDEETGFDRHGARSYAPWLGRWTSCDPAGPADGSNLYTYCSGNPVNLVDPSGLQPEAQDNDVILSHWNSYGDAPVEVFEGAYMSEEFGWIAPDGENWTPIHPPGEVIYIYGKAPGPAKEDKGFLESYPEGVFQGGMGMIDAGVDWGKNTYDLARMSTAYISGNDAHLERVIANCKGSVCKRYAAGESKSRLIYDASLGKIEATADVLNEALEGDPKALGTLAAAASAGYAGGRVRSAVRPAAKGRLGGQGHGGDSAINPTMCRTNCAWTAVALDESLAGKPQVAGPAGLTEMGMLETYYGRSFEPLLGIDDVPAMLSFEGPGARGIVLAERASGPGHFFNAVRFDAPHFGQQGVVHFLDAQSGAPARLAHYTGFWFLSTTWR